MHSRTLTFGAAVAAALGLHGCAAADQDPGAGRPRAAGDDDGALRRLPVFRALDTDEDGAISSGEIDAAAASLASLDDDVDGRLSAAELRPRRGGSIGGPARTPREATAAFLTMDADGDGALAGAEILALMTAEAEGPGGGEQAQGEEREAAPAGAGGEGRGPPPSIPLMAALDADGDDAVSEAEMESAAQALRSLDGNGDGRLTADELRNAAVDDSSGGDRQE